MKCPYYLGEMVKGNIIGDRNNLKWLPETENLVMGIWVKGGIELGRSGGLFGRPKVEAFRCNVCHKLIIDRNEEMKSGGLYMQYMCSKCGETFKITFLQYILGPRILGGPNLLKCPHCGKWSYCPIKAI